MRSILFSEDILSPKAHKSTKKALQAALKEKQKQTSSKKEQEKILS